MKYFIAFAIGFASLTAKSQTQVDFFTNYGDFRIELYGTLVPITVTNFLDLVSDEFYDGVIFHRVIDNFMIQGGAGSPVPPAIQDEFDSTLSNVQKTISMANAGPNTGTCQFFINLVNNTYLDFDKPPFTSKHPVFGITISGFSVVQTIGGVPTDGNDKPINDVVMDSVRIVGEPVGISTADREITKLHVFPNPVNSQATINFKLAETDDVNIGIYDAQGKLVEQVTSGKVAAGIHSVLWEAENQPAGAYTIRLFTSKGITTKQFVKGN